MDLDFSIVGERAESRMKVKESEEEVGSGRVKE